MSDDWTNEQCGNCAHFTGEECDGKFEGNERYADSTACDEFELVEDKP